MNQKSYSAKLITNLAETKLWEVVTNANEQNSENHGNVRD